MKIFKLIYVGYVIHAIFIFLYSLTQIDLSLTISRIQYLQAILFFFQRIGYYNRPFSTVIYIGILVCLYLLYIIFLLCVYKGNITRKQFWITIFSVGTILCFSYPAFSYDIFNYLFQARTVLVYSKSPYQITALQFAGIDPWVSFMRWTHTTSSYSPVWITISLIPYIFGFGYLLLILWNFKILFYLSYLICVWSIEKIVTLTDSKNALFAASLFALNPLILIESIVSPHNDIVMMAFCMIGWVFLIINRLPSSFFFFAFSASIKTMTIFLFPVFFVRKNIELVACICMVVALFIGVWRRELLPWYMLWVLPFIALQPKRIWLSIISGFISLGFLLQYAPFLYYGNYSLYTRAWQQRLFFTTLGLGIFIIGVKRLFLFSSGKRNGI